MRLCTLLDGHNELSIENVSVCVCVRRWWWDDPSRRSSASEGKCEESTLQVGLDQPQQHRYCQQHQPQRQGYNWYVQFLTVFVVIIMLCYLITCPLYSILWCVYPFDAVDFSQQAHWTGLISEMELVPVTHPDVTCDSCDMYPLTGARYECTICENFDFCEPCFQTKRSHRHNFNKIAEPSKWSSWLLVWQEGRPG